MPAAAWWIAGHVLLSPEKFPDTDLLESMLRFDPTERTNLRLIEEAMKHPYFWALRSRRFFWVKTPFETGYRYPVPMRPP